MRVSKLNELETTAREAEERLHDFMDLANRLDEERRRLVAERRSPNVSAVRLVEIRSRIEALKVDLEQADRQVGDQARIAMRARSQANRAAARLRGARGALEAVRNPTPGTDVLEFSPATRRRIEADAREIIRELT